jgi:tRNA(fMet)-specific endonuclease VapC
MTQVIEAVYEQGAFKPLEPVELPEGQRVTLSVEPISLMTRFKVMRGLKAKNATAQLAAFDAQWRQSDVLPITGAIIVRAADFYAELKQRGKLISDADLIIAATAVLHGLVLVTTNTAHFGRISGLALDCWTML